MAFGFDIDPITRGLSGAGTLFRGRSNNDEEEQTDRPQFRSGGLDTDTGLNFPRGRITPERRTRIAEQVLADLTYDQGGEALPVTYDTLMDLQVVYHEMLDVPTFLKYLQDEESSLAAMSGDAYNEIKTITSRYTVLDDLQIDNFELKDKYSFVEMMSLPASFTDGQVGALNAKFELTGIYDYYNVPPPKFVDDPLDSSFNQVWKYVVADAVGRGTTVQAMLDERTQRQMAAIEEGLAGFNDRTIAIELDKMAMQLRGKPLTAQEFEAIKSSIAMFDEDITDEEITGGIERQLDVLQQPSRIAMSDEAGLNFQRDAEVALRNYFKDDARTSWFNIQRSTQGGMDFNAYDRGALTGDGLEDVPAIIEEQESAQT